MTETEKRTDLPPEELSVCVHAWYWTDDEAGNGEEYQEYTDDPDLADGWCVYLRRDTPGDEIEPFELEDEVDYATREEALAAAEALASAHGCGWEEY